MKLAEISLWLCAIGALYTAWDLYQVNQNMEFLSEREHLETCEKGDDLWPQVMEQLLRRASEDGEFRAIVQATIVSFVDKIAKTKTREIIQQELAVAGQTFLPQDIGYFFQNLGYANYSSSATVVSDWAHRMSLSLYQHLDLWYYWNYRTNLGDNFEVASQAAAIVAKTKYLSNSTLVSDGSAIGNILSALPGQIEATLGDQATMGQFAKDCITLATRVHSADFRFCYKDNWGGEECHDFNEDVALVTNAVTNVCKIIQTSSYY